MTRFEPAGALLGVHRPPPDKSISHRAALLAAMSEGDVVVHGYLDARDTRSTLAAVAALGAGVRGVDGDPIAAPSRAAGAGLDLVIAGVGLQGARESGGGAIDVGNAGTLLRLLPGWLAGQEGRSWTLDGDESIRRRPVDRVAEPLRRMGARLEAREGRLPPLRVHGSRLVGADHELDVASAQVKSCLLVAGLLADGSTCVSEPAPSRDHTERMLARAGAAVVRDAAGIVGVRSSQRLELDEVDVPGDPSSAAFLVAAACLVPGSRLRVERVGLNWTRTGFYEIARRMGAAIEGELETPGAIAAHEPIGALEVTAGPLRATTVEAGEVPLAIDELPLVVLLGAFAEGETVVRGAQELRVKESDRIAGVVDGLGALGADIEATADGFAVRGMGSLRGGRLDARGDHRLAMLGAVAGLASREGVEVAGMDAAAVSYPGFESELARLLGQ